ncbi:MAG: hypothetical protein Fur0019_16560 [Tibeticola sp.]
MGPIDALWHVLNFLAPAAATAALLAAWGAISDKKCRNPSVIRSLFAILFVVGVAVLAAGLILLGHDGRMPTYAALVLAQTSALALVWRR